MKMMQLHALIYRRWRCEKDMATSSWLPGAATEAAGKEKWLGRWMWHFKVGI